MLSVLKDYDEDIISINYDNVNVTGRAYTRSFQTHKKALPLNVYGDGMKKAVLLMSAVIAAEDGVLLIDEFENCNPYFCNGKYIPVDFGDVQKIECAGICNIT